MPTKPKRPCSHSGCPELTDTQYCEKHKRESDSHYNHHQRDPRTRSWYGRAWKRIRDRYIKAHPLCEECEKHGRLTPAAEIHHIIPICEKGSHIETNLMSLCSSCHSAITARYGGRWRRK